MKAVRKLRIAFLLGLLLSALLAWAVNWQAEIIENQRLVIQDLERERAERAVREQYEQRTKRVLEHLRLPAQPGASLGCLPHQECG